MNHYHINEVGQLRERRGVSGKPQRYHFGVYLANNVNTVLFCNYGSSANKKAQFIKGEKKEDILC